jgi:hypothetical protein
VNFGKVLETVSDFLEAREYRYGVVGGVALAAYGFLRTTVDLDFVVEARAQDDLFRFLESQGYQTLHRSSGYSNHEHPDPSRGRVDFVYVRGETSEELFAGCRTLYGPGDKEIPVPRPEHLSAMKVLAMKNDPSKIFQEMADVRFLLTLPGVDRHEVEGYFERHGMKEIFDELEKTT